MPALSICGFEIPVARGSADENNTVMGIVDGRSLNGNPGGGYLADVESGNFSSPQIRLSSARAIQSLCRPFNGHVWHADNSVYASTGLAMTDTPGFGTTEKKFGTHSVQINTGAGTGDIDVMTIQSTAYTVSLWCKDGAGAWTHYVLRSDGAKWVDNVRNDSATLPFVVTSSVWTLSQDATNLRYFDELVMLPFDILDEWGLTWPLTETFPELPDVKVGGDLLSGFTWNRARAMVSLEHRGMAGFSSGLALSAVVSLTITAGERSEA